MINAKELYIGNEAVKEVYLGSNLIWQYEKLKPEEFLITYHYDTNFTAVPIPENAVAMDIFLVGGGGGGGSWYTWGYTPGSAGLGGECFCKRNILLTNLSSVYILCGNGGKKATTTTSTAKSASNGGDTMLYIDNATYVAKGGIGGYNSFSNSVLNKYTYSDGSSDFIPDFISRCVDLHGYDNRTNTLYGIEGSYMLGITTFSRGHRITANSVIYDEKAVIIDSYINNKLYEVYDVYDFGVPAFFEEGMPTFGALGAILKNYRTATTIGPQGSVILNTTDGFVTVNASGYGGGGFGGSYRGTDVIFGGDGTSGAVVIRWYFGTPKEPEQSTEPKVWTQLAYTTESTDYRRITYNVYQDKKIYAIATTAATTSRPLWCSFINFFKIPKNPNLYGSASVCNNVYIEKNVDRLKIQGEYCYAICARNGDNGFIRTYAEGILDNNKKLLPSTHYAFIDACEYKTIEVEGSSKNAYVYYFPEPLYLGQILAAVDVETWYALVDESTTQDERKFLAWVS